MIIGEKDRERVRLLEVHLKLANELIEEIRGDLEEIAEKLRSDEIVDTTDYPYMKLYQDIGYCSGHLQECK